MNETLRPVPLRCPCGAAMRLHTELLVWFCPATDDGTGWGRPKAGHLHYVPDEVLGDGYALGCILRDAQLPKRR